MIDDIVRRCQEGDTSAFHELLRIHGGMIQKISMRMTRNEEWQRDIFQDVMEQLIVHITSFRGECKFSTWLYRVTINASLRFLQHEANHKKTLPFDEAEMGHPIDGEGALDHIERKELFRHIMDALSTLPSEYKDILSLYYFAEMKIEEIAEFSGKSSGAVKAVLWKGRRAIIKKLSKRGLLKLP